MEESEKINGKKRLPSIPSNFVTLLQLQDRWIKEKERKQKGKGEGEEEGGGPQQQEEKEAISDERFDDEVSGRGSRKDGRFSRFKRDNGKRVAVGKPSDEKIAMAEDFDTELKDDGLKKKKKKTWKNKKKNGMEEKAGAANKGEEVKERAGNELRPASTENNEDEKLIGDEVHAPKLPSVKARREWQLRINPRTHGLKAEIGPKFQAMSLDGEIRTGVQAPERASVEARRESQPNIIPRTHGRRAEIGQKFQATSLDVEIRTGVHAPEPASVESRRESQPNIIPRTHGRKTEIGQKFQAMSLDGEIRTGVHALEPASVEARREPQPNLIPSHGCKAERKFQVMSMNGESRTRYNGRYGRQNVDFKFNHRRGIPELKMTYDGKFGRRRELNPRNEGMIWVKKGEVKDKNASGIQSSSQMGF
ncbi:hypothetical protein V6N13_120911 [Hibiscus sabdariffa]|uniref:Uncharacterized protein n=1 Tax=Hibiscus sabdariffa TaxID=183260 RepID=A0ABR2E5L6_9ROSI